MDLIENLPYFVGLETLERSIQINTLQVARNLQVFKGAAVPGGLSELKVSSSFRLQAGYLITQAPSGHKALHLTATALISIRTWGRSKSNAINQRFLRD